jgi:hypothetical protein
MNKVHRIYYLLDSRKEPTCFGIILGMKSKFEVYSLMIRDSLQVKMLSMVEYLYFYRNLQVRALYENAGSVIRSDVCQLLSSY